MNAHCERMIRSLKEECLNQLIIFGIERMDHILWTYLRFFNEHRPHQGLDNRTPRQVLESIEPPAIMEDEDIDPARVECTEFLGGLLKYYRLKAA